MHNIFSRFFPVSPPPRKIMVRAIMAIRANPRAIRVRVRANGLALGLTLTLTLTLTLMANPETLIALIALIIFRKGGLTVKLGDFNMEPDKSNIKTFMENHDLYNLIKSNTCFKSPTGNVLSS